MSSLSNRVERIRRVLAERPDGIRFADFPPGRTVSADGLPPGVAEALAATDGPRGGDIIIHSAAEFAADDFSPLGAEAIADADAGDWQRCGANNDEPLLLHRQSGEVWWFPDTGVLWLDSPQFEKLSDDLATFMTDYLLGAGYRDICSDDEWAQFLDGLGEAADDKIQE